MNAMSNLDLNDPRTWAHTTEGFNAWLREQPLERQQFLMDNPLCALARITQDLEDELSRLAVIEAVTLREGCDDHIIISVGSRRITRKQMKDLRAALVAQAGDSVAGMVTIVAMDLLDERA